MLVQNLAALQSWISETLIPTIESSGQKIVIFLHGPMGAGKTQLLRFLAQSLGCPEGDIQSPSFSIHNRYPVASGQQWAFDFLDHLDLYRLEGGEDELESVGFWDLLSQSSGLLVIEWPERLPEDCIPPGWKKIQVEIQFAKSEAVEGVGGAPRYLGLSSL